MLSLANIEKTYGKGGASFKALKDVSININERDSLAIVGASGSGKSTLLHIMGCLDSADRGTVA